MSQLVSDSAQVEISKRVLDTLRTLYIGDLQNEPYQHHQHPAERRYYMVKQTTKTLLDCSGSPTYTWLLAMGYVCFLLNLTLCSAVNGIPTQCLIDSTPDINPLLRFCWYQHLYYKVDDSNILSGTHDERG